MVDKSIKWIIMACIFMLIFVCWMNRSACAEVMRVGKYGKILNTPAQLQAKVLTASEQLAPTTKDFTAKVEASNYTAFSDKVTGKVRFEDNGDYIVMSIRDTKGLAIDYKSTQGGMKEIITVAEKVETVTIVYDITSSCTETKFNNRGDLVFINPITGNDMVLVKPFVIDQDAKVTVAYDKGVYTLTVDSRDLKFPLVIDPTINADDVDATSGRIFNGNVVWLSGRNKTAGSADGTQLQIGSIWNINTHYTYRSLVRYDTSSLGTSAIVDSVKAIYPVTTDESVTDFKMILLATQDSVHTNSLVGDHYNAFKGWVDSSGAKNNPYSTAIGLSDSVTTVGMGASITFTMNATGIASINKTGISQSFILSNHDIWAMPLVGTNNERVLLNDDTSYLEIYYHLPTHYVDYTGGSDSNEGYSAATAWKTIDKVNNHTFVAGDSILFKKGEHWHEQLTIGASGTAALPIVYSSYSTGAKPVIDGDATLTYGIYGDGKDYITIDGLEISNLSRSVAASYGIYLRNSDGSVVKNCYLHDLYYPTNPTPGSTAWEKKSGYGIYLTYTSAGGACEIHDNTIRHSAIYGITVYPSSGVTVDNFKIYNNNIDSTNVCVALAAPVANAHITNAKIYGNTFGEGGGYYYCGSWHRDNLHLYGLGSAATGTIDTVSIYNNTFDHTNETTNGTTATVYIEYKVTNIKMYNNLFKKSGGDYTIRFNKGGTLTAFASTDSIYNNTFYAYNKNDATKGSLMWLYGRTGMTFVNNIVDARLLTYYYQTAADTAGMKFTNNRYYVNGSASATQTSFVLGTSYKTLAQMQTLGYETNSSYGDPTFVSRGVGGIWNFHLQGGSACIQGGFNPPMLSTDIEGASFANPPSMGAYRYLLNPVAPTSLASTVNRATWGTLTWTKAVASDKTYIYCNGALIDSVAAAVETYTMPNRTAGTVYNYLLKNNYTNTLSDYSNGITVTSPYYTLARPKP
jgi:hypothetical protein